MPPCNWTLLSSLGKMRFSGTGLSSVQLESQVCAIASEMQSGEMEAVCGGNAGTSDAVGAMSCCDSPNMDLVST